MEPTPLSELDILKNFRVKMFGKVFLMQPAADLELHPSSIGESLQEQPSRYAFYASVRDMAQAKVEALALQVKQKEAALDQEYRISGALPGGVKITETGMLCAIRNDGNYQTLQEEHVESQHHLALLNTIVRAFEQRRDCLMAMSSRANNTTFNDQDLNVTVSARIRSIEEFEALKQKAKEKNKRQFQHDDQD